MAFQLFCIYAIKRGVVGVVNNIIFVLLSCLKVAGALENIDSDIIARARVATELIEWRSSRALIFVTMNIDARNISVTVSYTHLTLPTILRV